MQTEPKQEYDLLIVGGGIIGSAIAYYFKRNNPAKRVLLTDRNELCSGNTSLSAALLSRIRPYEDIIPLSIETYRVIPELETILGNKIPVRYSGAIHCSRTDKGIESLGKLADLAERSGLECSRLNPRGANRLVPWLMCNQKDMILFFRDEAFTDGYILGMSFAGAAKRLGVEFLRNTPTTELIRRDNKITGINTCKGAFYSNKTILAAGVWSIVLAEKAGINIPTAPVRSQYWITQTHKEYFYPEAPSVVIADSGFYARPQGQALLFGIREKDSLYIDPRSLPQDISGYNFSSNQGWDDLISNYSRVENYFPELINIGIKSHVTGLSAYTPDSHFIAGSVKNVEGILLATGFSGAGISVAGGIGLGMARMAAEEKNPFDFSGHEPDRYGKIDPYSDEHLRRCAAARSAKTCG